MISQYIISYNGENIIILNITIVIHNNMIRYIDTNILVISSSYIYIHIIYIIYIITILVISLYDDMISTKNVYSHLPRHGSSVRTIATPRGNGRRPEAQMW